MRMRKKKRMVPLLYKEALEKYYLMTLLNSVDELGSDANDFIFVPERIQPMTYLRQGYEMVKDISDIVRLNGDKEAEGMATVYEADYQMLLGLGLAEEHIKGRWIYLQKQESRSRRL